MIEMQPSPEQEQIIDSVSAMLSDQFSLDRLRPEPRPKLNDDASRFQDLGSLGVFALALPEHLGGAGYGLIEEILLAREYGRYLLSPSCIATTVAAKVAAASGDEGLAGRIGAGEMPVAMAIPFGPSGEDATTCHLFDANPEGIALVWGEAGLSIVGPEAWTEWADYPCIDSTVHLVRAHLDIADSDVLSDSDRFARQALLLTSAYLVGIAEASCAQSVEYAKVRHQFGQPIGAFQSVKHRCADMLTRASAAWNLTLFAGLADVAGGADAAFQAIAAKLMASDAAYRNAATNIQNHGGIGFTGEHDAHLFVKRAHIFDRFGGDMGMQKKRLLREPAPV